MLSLVLGSRVCQSLFWVKGLQGPQGVPVLEYLFLLDSLLLGVYMMYCGLDQ